MNPLKKLSLLFSRFSQWLTAGSENYQKTRPEVAMHQIISVQPREVIEPTPLEKQPIVIPLSKETIENLYATHLPDVWNTDKCAATFVIEKNEGKIINQKIDLMGNRFLIVYIELVEGLDHYTILAKNNPNSFSSRFSVCDWNLWEDSNKDPISRFSTTDKREFILRMESARQKAFVEAAEMEAQGSTWPTIDQFRL